MIKKIKGFSLIEVIIFVVIAGLVGTGVMTSYNIMLSETPKIGNNEEANLLAQERMSIILADKKINGFAGLKDPCKLGSPPAICQSTSGFTVDSTITSSWSGNSNLKQITVTVTGDGNATLVTVVGNYS